tara:strand:- start:39854 stop:40450 length:597 start_codon:yes stop_codon:yes gene_type:complete
LRSDNEIKRQIVRLVQSCHDIQEALSAVTFLMDEADYESESSNYIELRRWRCFEVTAIISFLRPFTQTRGGTTLSRKLAEIAFTGNDLELFRKLEKLRNHYIAHSSEEGMNFRLDVRKTSMPRDNGEVFEIKVPFVVHDEGLLLVENEAFRLMDMLRYTGTQINEKIWNLSQENPDLLEMVKSPDYDITEGRDTPKIG